MDEDTSKKEREVIDDSGKKTDDGSRTGDLPSQNEQSVDPRDNYGRLAKFLRRAHGAISEYRTSITSVATISAFILTVLNIFYETQLQEFVPTLVASLAIGMTSNATIVTLLLVVILLQIYQIRAGGGGEQDSKKIRTDGGSDLPPRDSKGRFTSESSGPDLLMVLLAALAGFTAGSQFGETEALIGAFLGIAVITYLGE